LKPNFYLTFNVGTKVSTTAGIYLANCFNNDAFREFENIDGLIAFLRSCPFNTIEKI